MSLLKRFLGLDIEEDPSQSQSPTLRRIVEALEGMPEERAHYLAAFAYVLGRVANADMHISDDETNMIEHLVEEYGGVSEDKARVVVEIVKEQNQLFGGTENFLVTQELTSITDRDQREHILHCLFAVAAADDSISNTEDREIRQIASELGFEHRDFVHVRSAYSDKREVMKQSKG